MPYIPKSQIKTDLYTYGNEYMLSKSKEPYKGYYYEVSTGKKYTGKKPSNSINEIIPIPLNYNNSYSDRGPLKIDTIPRYNTTTNQNQTLIEQYEDHGENTTYYNSKNPPTIRYIPSFHLPFLTIEDTKNGYIKRYFSKKNNEYRYKEIDFASYTKLINKDTSIAWDAYSPACVIWQISGNIENAYSSNFAQTLHVEGNQNWIGFSQYFKSRFSQFHISLNNNNNSQGGGGSY